MFTPFPILLSSMFHNQQIRCFKSGFCYSLPNPCCCSVTKSYPTLCDPMDHSMLGPSVLHYLSSLLKFMPIESVIHSLPLASHVFSLSQHQIFSSEFDLRIMWPKYWNFSFSVSPSNEYLGLISFAAAAAKSL